ncbi:hypothetical protein L596_009134 [Steinernema carpocapsae]|uniref:Sushi domain-containing protein n=1 Tax=Steinernema carpocapsae TaxID=34508 RepID=A0A4U5PEI8_STECR|nr:hypothetical protein L596_009134 [Steinernema carpocapsae]
MLRGAQTSTCNGGMWNPPNLGSCSGQFYNPPPNNLITASAPVGVQFPVETSKSPAPGPSQCALLDQIVSHGVIEYSDRFNPTGPFAAGVTAALTCGFGFVVSGTPKVSCSGGTWIPARLGECQQTEGANTLVEVPQKDGGCSTMQMKLSDGYLDIDRTQENGFFPVGTTANLQCKGGYTPQGNTKSNCKGNQWHPSLGSCVKARDSGSSVHNCQPLVPPFNGRISYIQASSSNNYQTGTTAILNCELGYVVDGQAALSCTQNGWKPQPGFGQCRLNNEIYG